MSSTDILQTGYITETDADVRAALHKEEASILPEPHSENLWLGRVHNGIENVLWEASYIAETEPADPLASIPRQLKCWFLWGTKLRLWTCKVDP